MEKVIPVIINGEAQLIDEAELRNICALENIPYDSPPPSVDPPKNVEPTSPPPKEVHSESAQVPGPPPLSIVNSQPLTLIKSGNIIAVPISSQGISTVGDTILVTRPRQIEVLSAQSSDVIYSAEELHMDPSQAVTEMIKLVAPPSGQKADLVIANESAVNAEELPHLEYTPVNGLQVIGAAGANIRINPKSNQKEVCELILQLKGTCVRHRVIVPCPSSQADFSEITQHTRRLFGDIERPLVYIITEQKLVASTDNQLVQADNNMGVVASVDAPQLEEGEIASEAQMSQVGEAQMGTEVALQVGQPVQMPQSQNIYFRTAAGQASLVSPTQMIVRPTTALMMPTTPVALSHTVGQALILPSQNVVTTVGGQVYQLTPMATDNKVVVQLPNQPILPKPETPKQVEDPLKSVSNGIKDTGGGKPDDQNQLVEVFYAHCDHCGHNSRDLKVCQKCRRPMSKDAKLTSQKMLPTAVVASRNPEGYCLSVRCNSCSLISTDLKLCFHCKNPISEGATRSYIRLGTKELSKLEAPKRKKCQRKKKVEEPVTLSLLSSDEEEGDAVNQKKSKLLTLVDKEPVITNETVSPCSLARIEGGGLDLADIITSPDVERALLQCRTVRIGSYKTVPDGKVAITEYGLYIKIPALETKEMVTVKIFKNEIVKILGNFGKTVPVLFYYTTANAADKIRRILQMSPPEQHRGPYYDPTSSVEMHRRITLLPEKISEETRLFLKCTYDNQCLLENLSTDEANSILIKASPSEAPVDNQPSMQTPSRKDNFVQPPTSSGTNSSTPSNVPIQAIMVYPPPPAKGGISINTEDYGCLGEDNFLNDVIIDFYLKYFVQTQLTPEDQHRTHVFSSFFYKRLTTKIPPRPDDKQSAAERRHTRVRSWTKHVDLFSKDFIIIPINENSHWFLGVVCFPGLTNAVRLSDGKPVANPSKRRESGVPQMIGGTTITRVNQEPMTITIEPDEEDRDEAEADDDDLEPNTSDDEPCEEAEEGSELLDDATHPVPKIKVKKEPLDAIKQPCILIFDSLAGASRSKVCATLREYLQVEYNVRHRGSKGKREINKNTMRASVVKVPQQTNYTDCGLYVLQYTEAFFQNPITDYRMPIRQLVQWFDTKIVSKKRYEIQQLLHKLMEEQNVDTTRLNLPALNLHPEGTGKVFHDEEEEEMPEDMEDMDYEDMEEDEEMMGEEEEDEEIAEFHRKMVANAPMTGNSPMSGNSMPSGNNQSTPGEDIRARLQRRELTISSSIANSIGSSVSIITSTSTTAPSPAKPVLQPPTIPNTPNVPSTISVSRKIVADSSTPSPSKTPQHSSHSKYEHLSITSTTVGSSGAKRKVTSVSLKDVRNPRLPPTPSTPNRSVDIKKVRTE